ncbi:MAG: hypothetical protein PHP32_04305 [Candidatus Izemoplasmatales bacterium]|nr:hypothetical protein [Candidatus Izemoplasmatales bacterium]
MKKLLAVSLAFVLLFALAGCGETTTTTTTTASTGTTSSVDLTNVESDTGLDKNVSGIVDIVLWSGSGTTYYDLGHQNLTPEQLPAQNDAAAYAVAKAFNEIYPNIVINGYFKSGGPDNWTQVLETYADDEGRFPSVWAAMNMSNQVSTGVIADLSRFEDDPLYQQLNPSVMGMMNYYGFQAGLPQYILPWGVYVNKTLAAANGIEMPNYDWDIDEYTDFTSNYSIDPENMYFGAMDTPLSFIETGTSTIRASLASYTGGDTFVNLNSAEVRDLLSYIHEWVDSTFWGQYDKEALTITDGSGPVASLYANAGSWDYHLFRQGYLLTFDGQPWMMGDCAETDPDWWAVCNIDNWDIYPRPATDYEENTFGIVLDPMAVYNFCLDDGDLACSVEEELKIQIAYTFAIFWCADSRSFEARANQTFYDASSDSYSSALNDSLPVVTGEMFDDQMAYWYTPSKHQRFNAMNEDDEYLMPGFQYILDLYEQGQFWDVSDKAFPWSYSADGVSQTILYEWQNYWNPEVNGGKAKFDADFTSTIQSLLPTWNDLSNARWATEFNRIKSGLSLYYYYDTYDIN